MTTGWRLRSVLSEAISNVASSVVRTLLLGIAISGALAALAWAELSFSADVKEQARQFAAAGGYVAVVSGPQGVDASRCDLLRRRPDVVAVGGVRGGGQITVSSAPTVAFQRFEVTPGIIGVWDPAAGRPSSSGYMVGSAAAQELGLVTGSWVSMDGSDAARATVFDPALRNRFAARALMDVVPPAGRFDQCWIEYRPASFESRFLSLPTMFAADEVEARRAIDRGEFAQDPAEVFANRPQRWGWLPVGGVGAAMIALLALFRRPETAVYRAFGLSRTGLLIMEQAEIAVLAVGSFVLANVWAALAHTLATGSLHLDQVVVALSTSGQAAALMLVVGPLAAALAAAGTPSSLLRER